MHLQFVGCGDAFGSGGRFNTCFHLVGKNVNALIDCGATSLVAMNRLGIDRNAITTIFISHFHADHIFGLPFFILEANYVTKRTQPLTIVGPPGLKTRFPELMECAFPGTGGMALNFELALQELNIGTRNDIGSVGVTPSHVVHDDRAGPCLGFRFEAEGKVLAFSGDTEWTEALIDVGREADLFICEAYTRDKPITTHMALSLLEQHLSQIRPKRLILTHMSNEMLVQAGKVPYETAEDGKIVEI
jgi:ribonuclease BN (tRNA processing enzyme)